MAHSTEAAAVARQGDAQRRPKTTFRAITDLGVFTRTSQSHNREKPFTHVVLMLMAHGDDRGTRWHSMSWCGSPSKAIQALRATRKRYANDSRVQALRIERVEIVEGK